MPATLRSLGFVFLMITLGGCKPPAAGAPPAPSAILPDSGADDGAASVSVENNAIWDVRLFILRGAQRNRLGMVISTTTATFRIPPAYLTTDLVFYAEAVGAPFHQMTDPLNVRANQDVKLVLEKKLRSYLISVR